MNFDEYKEQVVNDFFDQEEATDNDNNSTNIADKIFAEIMKQNSKVEIDINDSLLTEQDVVDALKPWFEKIEVDEFDSLFCDMQLDDSVTGNGSGAYCYCSYDEAKANVKDALWDDEIHDHLNELEFDIENFLKNPCSTDVIIRCVALDVQRERIFNKWSNLVIDKVLDKIDEKRKEMKLKLTQR